MIKIRVPATSANVGPGFDCLGLALQLYANYTFEEIEGLQIIGCEERFQNEDNLIYLAFKKTMEHLHYDYKGLKLTIQTDIPVSRGLGSSATCVVGGIMGANAIAGNPLSKAEILLIASEMEGHPDNVAPAIYGGLCASFMEGSTPYTVEYQMHPDLYFTAMIPNFETKTSDARNVLPTSVSFKEAIYNVSRTSVLLKALEIKDNELIKHSIKDSLHQPFRKHLIHEYDEVEKICNQHKSIAFFISGSGSTLMSISENPHFDQLVQNDLTTLQYNWKAITLKVDTKGAIQC